MAEGRMKDRVKGLLAGSHQDPDQWAGAAPPLGEPIPTQMTSPEQAMAPGRRPSAAGRADSDAERQALQVLMLARRTGDEYVALANRHADATKAEARATAEQIVREAQLAADRLRGEAERERAEAHSTAVQAIESAQARAADLEREAQERYDAAIGGLAEERAELQQQIEALHLFDREYRTRLRVFMHGQLRALDEGEPAAGDIPTSDQAMPGGTAERS